jgi:membrane protein DedA with SNARE-associated domain
LTGAEQRLRGNGVPAIVVGRIVPGVRVATAVACGVVEYPAAVFLTALIAGSMISVGICLAVGVAIDSSTRETLTELGVPLGLLVNLLITAGAVVWFVRARRGLTRPRPATVVASAGGQAGSAEAPLVRVHWIRAGAFAGALATCGTTSTLAVVTYLGVVFGTRSSMGQPELLLGAVGMLTLILFGVGWGIAYARLEDTWHWPTPDWVRGLVYALVVPLPCTVLVGVVLSAVLGLPQRVLAIGVFGMLASAFAYGLLLGLSYPVFRLHRGTASSFDAARGASCPPGLAMQIR